MIVVIDLIVIGMGVDRGTTRLDQVRKWWCWSRWPVWIDAQQVLCSVGVDIKVIMIGLPCPAGLFYSWQRNCPCCLVEEMFNPKKDQSSKILIVPLSTQGLYDPMDQRLTEIINRNRQPGIPAKSTKYYHDARGLLVVQIILMLMSTHILGP